jgi:hypothetical protein
VFLGGCVGALVRLGGRHEGTSELGLKICHRWYGTRFSASQLARDRSWPNRVPLRPQPTPMLAPGSA